MQLKDCPNLHKVVLSPGTACPKLASLDLSGCTALQYVLVQSHSLQTLDLRNDAALTKVRASVSNGVRNSASASLFDFASCKGTAYSGVMARAPGL
jgi:hypothetical protein